MRNWKQKLVIWSGIFYGFGIVLLHTLILDQVLNIRRSFWKVFNSAIKNFYCATLQKRQINNYLLKGNDRNSGKRCEICSKLKISRPESTLNLFNTFYKSLYRWIWTGNCFAGLMLLGKLCLSDFWDRTFKKI